MASPVPNVLSRMPQICGLWFSFLAYSLIRAPIPAVNEPHYLVKARHYWQPDWCAGDLFLESSNPHLVFYQTFGWLTEVMSFEAAALVGRVIALLLLAIGWDRLVSLCVAGRWTSLATAWLFLLLQAYGNFAGEWLVGGVESKVVAYAFVMWGCGLLLNGRPKTGGALIGAAVSFHPVVGAWCVVGIACAVPLTRLKRLRTGAVTSETMVSELRRLAPAVACGLLCSLPGLIPAVAMLSHPDTSIALRADIIQVAIRLDHHLDPYMFPWKAYGWYAAMIVVWLGIRFRVPGDGSGKWLDAFTWVALAIGVVGWVAAAGPRPITHLPLLSLRIKLLKLYPFRIADLSVPFALAVAVVQMVTVRAAGTSGNRRRMLIAAAFVASLLLPGADKNPSRMTPSVRADWIAALGWIKSETTHEIVLWMPDEDWAVKWFCERPEYVNFKDCPQDAAGIVEWYERRVRLAEWKRAAAADGRLSIEELAELHEQTGITHVVASRIGPVDLEPVYANASFRAYDIAGLNGSEPRNTRK